MNRALTLWLACSYLLGSIPTGLWLGKVWKGIDVRQHGSGNLGATNVFRVLGAAPGIITLILDIAKGWLPVYLFTHHVYSPENLHNLLYSVPWGGYSPGEELALALFGPNGVWLSMVLVGLAAILGHIFSPFVRFRGGKGVATAAGVFMALMTSSCVIAIGVFVLVMTATRIVSISSILASLSLAVSSFFLPYPLLFRGLAILVGLFIVFTHRANIQRVLAGTEPRLHRLEKMS